MDEDESVPIILGRPFLATAHAIIDVHDGRMSLRVGKETVTFNIGNSIRGKQPYSDYLYCADQTVKFIHDQWMDTVHLDGKWMETDQNHEKAQAVFFHPRHEVEPLEWRAPENHLKPSIQKSPKLELKELPEHHIKGINSSFCTHKILMEDEYKPTVQSQRRVNPNIKEVVKKEVIKLLDAGLIYPISDSPWMLERIVGHEYYCFLDGLSGYFQILIAPEDQEKTTFTCPYGTFAYKRMPFGMCNAPATFQRCMMAIFHELIEDTMEEKCHFMVREGIVLRHKVAGTGIEAFEKLKHELTQALVMIKPDWSLPFKIMCDASDYAVGAVLGQGINNHFQPIHYASKTMNVKQENYTTTKKELLAVVFAFDKFRQYLVLTKTIVFIDHSALRYLFTKQDVKLDSFAGYFCSNRIRKGGHGAPLQLLTQAFSGKLKLRWYGPFTVSGTLKSEAIELCDKYGNEFIVNGQRVKPYSNDSKNFDSDEDIIVENHGGIGL
ncbi:reverse transcriptase domain-containing protein [Tanacetum coccineum]